MAENAKKLARPAKPLEQEKINSCARHKLGILKCYKTKN